MALSRDKKGHFLKGYRYSKATEFKKGQHWRKPKPYWSKEWLEEEYITKGKGVQQIANEQGCERNNIFYFLKKHNIKTRSMKEVRAMKYWGSEGKANPMYGKTGAENPNWKGGISPERQAFYASLEWKRVALKVKKRDKVCQRCRSKTDLHIHHIISFEVKELRTELSNLVLLCEECHFWVHSKKNIRQEFLESKDEYTRVKRKNGLDYWI